MTKLQKTHIYRIIHDNIFCTKPDQ